MKIQRTRPILFFDLESTSANVASARIVSIAAIKLFPDNTTESKDMLINPMIPIPAEATEVHGIFDADVENSPKFNQIARSLKDFMSGCDLSGYNIANYDIPLIVEEGLRCGVEFDFSGALIIDSCIIFKKKEERTLSAAIKFYTGKEMIDAHNALADVQASMHVLSAQIQVYPELSEMSIEELAQFSKFDGLERLDYAGFLLKNEEGKIIYGFGKWKGELVSSQLNYLKWAFEKSDFTQNTKIVTENLYKSFKAKK